MNINKQIFLTFTSLVVIILFFGISDIDITIQSNFYDFNTHSWILGHEAQPYKFIFYDGLKKLLIFIAICFLISLLFVKKSKIIKEYKKGIIIVVLSAIFIPAIVGRLKKATNMPCPKNEIHYGGIYPTTKVWEHYPKTFAQPDTIRCWPAGHASGGFALLSLFFFFKTKRNRYIALITAFIVGWSMGIYKMLIGDHFFSHTLITMVLAWLIILLIKKLVYKIL
jgi:membrane-associated PAP2 superfamily phosphatase